MDQMLRRPGLSMVSLDSPIHQPEEAQQFIPKALQQQQEQQSQQHQLENINRTIQTMILMGTSPKIIHRFLISKFTKPQDLRQPEILQNMISLLIQNNNQVAPPSIGPSTSGPMTSMTPASADSEILPKIQNIVSTVNSNCELDLKKIALHAKNAEYNPKKLAAVIMRIREPRTTALIFSCGKIVCTGAKSEEDSRVAARKFVKIIQILGFNARFLNFKILNIVSVCDVRFSIRLEALVLAHREFAIYEPEIFPGLVYNMVKPKMVLLIFFSGKLVLTGARVRQDIDEAFNNIYPILQRFKM